MSTKYNTDEIFSNLPLEREVLSGLLKFPNKFQNVISFLKDSHFQHPRHRNIFTLARQAYEKNEDLGSTVLTQKLMNLKISDIDGMPIADYVSNIFYSQLKEAAVEGVVKEMVKTSCQKEIADNIKKQGRFIVDNRNLPLDVLISELDKIHHNKSIEFFEDLTPELLFDNIDQTLEEINEDYKNGKNGLLGPFDTVNKLYGSLSIPGQLTIIGADSGVGKSSIGLYYNIWMCIKYGIPILHCDAGEMSRKQLLTRAICSLTGGQVSHYAIESGDYKLNEKSYKLVNEAKQKARNLPIYYEDTSGLTPLETHGLFRKYAFNVVGRGNPFVIHYDYLKPFDNTDSNDPEWKVLRDFANKTKMFLQNEIPWVSFWTSIQLNSGGATKNKKSFEIDDSSNSLAMSKAVKNSAAHVIILRPKAVDELEEQGLDYGTHILTWVKNRFLGKEAQRALNKVLIKDNHDDKGRLVDNVVYLKNQSFYFEDCGDTFAMAQTLNNKIDIEEDNKDDDARL